MISLIYLQNLFHSTELKLEMDQRCCGKKNLSSKFFIRPVTTQYSKRTFSILVLCKVTAKNVI